MWKRLGSWVSLAVWVALSAMPASAAGDTLAISEQWGQPGVHAIMRHALAPGTGDPVSFAVDDCSTQRNLNQTGREQASAIGTTLRQAGIRFDRILTSQWCRCRETARFLDMGLFEDFAGLNSFFADRTTSKAQTAEVRSFIASLAPKERVMLVTHQVNISALTGRGVSSGQVLFFKMNEAGDIEVLGDLLVRP